MGKPLTHDAAVARMKAFVPVKLLPRATVWIDRVERRGCVVRFRSQGLRGRGPVQERTQYFPFEKLRASDTLDADHGFLFPEGDPRNHPTQIVVVKRADTGLPSTRRIRDAAAVAVESLEHRVLSTPEPKPEEKPVISTVTDPADSIASDTTGAPTPVPPEEVEALQAKADAVVRQGAIVRACRRAVADARADVEAARDMLQAAEIREKEATDRLQREAWKYDGTVTDLANACKV